MKTKFIIASILGAAVTFSSAASAQEKVTVNGNIDLVNNYVWRGMDQKSGFSVQPTLGLSYKGLSLSAWGIQNLTNNADCTVQKQDINLSHSIGGLSATLADFWRAGCLAADGCFDNEHDYRKGDIREIRDFRGFPQMLGRNEKGIGDKRL